jgi:hypothetical protein
MALDVAVVSAFVIIGRASHHHGETAGGLVATGWPFLTGLSLAWAGLTAAQTNPASARRGVATAAVTVTAGMVLRVMAGQGTATSFVAVSLGFLGAGMVGGRILLGRYGCGRLGNS